MKEMNKTIQDLKMELETIKKSQKETTLEIENIVKRSGVIDASITNRIHEIEGTISGAEDTIFKSWMVLFNSFTGLVVFSYNSVRDF